MILLSGDGFRKRPKMWALYCATTALDIYPSLSDKIHYIWMATSFLICSTTHMNHANHHSCPHHSSHPPFTSGWYLLLSELSHLWATSLTHLQTASSKTFCASRSSAWPCGSYHFGEKPWNVVESKTMEILSGDRVPLETTRVPLVETVFKTWFSSL